MSKPIDFRTQQVSPQILENIYKWYCRWEKLG